jgi:hypothetical protein
MTFETEFDCGDRIYVVNKDHICGPYLVGMIRVEYIASQDGPSPENQFDNMGRQHQKYKESYMCFETGIETGFVYDAKDCFASEDMARIEIENRQAEAATLRKETA